MRGQTPMSHVTCLRLYMSWVRVLKAEIQGLGGLRSRSLQFRCWYSERASGFRVQVCLDKYLYIIISLCEGISALWFAVRGGGDCWSLQPALEITILRATTSTADM